MGYYDSDFAGTSISAKGTAETEFTSATYKATVTTTGKTGPEAKKKALPIMESVREVISRFAGQAKLDVARIKTTFPITMDTHRQTGEFVGYRATWTVHFTGRSVSEAPAVHDALTSLEGVMAETPTYKVNDSAEVHAAAFHDGVVKAREKFKGQCAALNVNPNDFYVRSWQIQEEQQHGKTLSFANAATDALIKAAGLEPGKATMDLTVTVTFVPKTETPPSPAHTGASHPPPKP